MRRSIFERLPGGWLVGIGKSSYHAIVAWAKELHTIKTLNTCSTNPMVSYIE